MFHIALCADENFMKYVAVLINSIITNTQVNKSFLDIINTMSPPPPPVILHEYTNNIDSTSNKEAYHFHIITDDISNTTREKMTQLELELQKIYPCIIEIYNVDPAIFKGMNKYGDFDTYAVYYRLLLDRFLPTHVKKVLYLDVDMIAKGDIRECFAIDLGDNILGVVLDSSTLQGDRLIKPKNFTDANKHDIKDITDNDLVDRILKTSNNLPLIKTKQACYFNSGFMLVNLDKWRSEHIESKSLDIAKKYHVPYVDQDVLNILIADKTKKLHLAWNIFVVGTKGYIDSPSYSKEEYSVAEHSAKIYHYAGCKPWENSLMYIQSSYIVPIRLREYRNLWWEQALKTPIFQDEMLQLSNILKADEVFDYINAISKLTSDNMHLVHARMQNLERRTMKILYPHKAFRDFIKKCYARLFT